MHLACQYHVKHSLQNCPCFLCRSWCVWLVAISPQPWFLPFSFFSWVPLLSWHPYFPLLPSHCVWHLCFHVLGSLLFLFMLHTPASFPCQFTCLLPFWLVLTTPAPLAWRVLHRMEERTKHAVLLSVLSIPEVLLSASFCLCTQLSLFFCVSVPHFLGWMNLCSRVSHSWDLQAQIDVVVGEVTGGSPSQLKNSVTEALKRETV